MATVKEILVPDIGNTANADVIEVNAVSGKSVKAEDPLITLETDKATMEIPSPYSGIVKDVKIKVGDKVSQGNLILFMEVVEPAAPGTVQQPSAPAASKEPVTAAPPAPVLNAPSVKPATAPSLNGNGAAVHQESNTTNAHAGPAVRRFARELGVDLTLVKGSGPKERILKEDIQGFVKAQLSGGKNISAGMGAGLPVMPAVDFAKFGEIEMRPLSKIKKLTGINLHRNWLLVPHVTQFDEADITEMEAFRQAQKNLADAQGVKLTPLVFLMKAVVASLKAFPAFNASLDSTGENLILKKYFHIGVAVDTPEGLVVPVVRDVDKKGLFELAKELAGISDKARNKGLAPADMQGSCFTISSLGGIGGTAFTPIVNAPDVAILGVSKASMKPVYQDGEFAPRLMLPLSLSYDHRVIDGAEGARFMVYLTSHLADIRQLLL